MRKLTILLAVVLVTSSSTGCLCGRCRNLFHKGSPCGSPCGTAVAPPVMGAPFAVGPPMTMAPCAAPMATPMVMAAPMVAPNSCCEQAPTCCVPCDPCGDPCGQGQGMPVTSGYFGNYMEGSAGCGCAAGAESATPTIIEQP